MNLLPHLVPSDEHFYSNKGSVSDSEPDSSWHIQCEGHLLNMEEVAANGCSKEQPPEASAGVTPVRHRAAAFVKLYETKEARLRDLLAEIQLIGVQVNKWNTKSKWSFYTGLVSAAVAVGTGLAIPVAGGIGFAITAALMSVSAGAAVFGFKIKQFRTEEESLKRIKLFLKIVNRLEHDLDEIMQQCRSLQRRPEEEEPRNIRSLKNNLEKLFQAMETLRAADGVNELTAQCQTVFAQMENTRRQLEEFRGGTNTEPDAHAQKTTETSTQGSANEQVLTDDGSESSSFLQQRQEADD